MNIFVHQHGEQRGPYTETQIREGLESGWLRGDDLAWYEGLDEWKRVDELFGGGGTETFPKAQTPAAPFSVEPESGLPAPTRVMRRTAPASKPSAGGAGAASGANRPSSAEAEPGGRASGRASRVEGEEHSGLGRALWLYPLLFVGGVLLLWLALTFFTAWRVERMLEESVEELASRPLLSSLEIRQESFQRGLLSSRSVVSVRSRKAEEGEPPARFVTEIHHGPIVFPEGKPSFLTAASVTTLDWAALGPKAAGLVETGFGGREPIELRSASRYDGSRYHDLILRPGSLEEEDRSLSFGGGSGRFDVWRNPDRVEGRFEVEALHLETREEGETVSLSMEPGEGRLDFEEGRRFQARGSLGALTLSGSAGGGVVVSEVDARADFHRLRPDVAVLVGEGEIRIPHLAVGGEGGEHRLEVEDLSIGSETREVNGKLASRVRYELANLDSGPEGFSLPGLPAERAAALEGATAVEFGWRGLDPEHFSEMQRYTRALQALQVKRMRSGEEDEEEPGLSEAEREAMSELLQGLLALVEPGAGFFLEADVGGEALQVDFDLGLGGDRKLRELETFRELLASVEGDLRVFLRHGILPPEEAEKRFGAQVEMGLIKRTDDGYLFEGGLQNGQVTLSGRPTPLLQMLGPFLDQPIPWDRILDGFPAKPSGASTPPSQAR